MTSTKRILALSGLALCLFGGICVSLYLNQGFIRGGVAAVHEARSHSASSTRAVLSITATPRVVDRGETSTLKWSANNVESCTVTGPSITATGKSGEKTTTALTAHSVYTLTCKIANNQTVSRRVMVTVRPDHDRSASSSLSIVATPSTVAPGQSTRISWVGKRVRDCIVTGPNFSATGRAGSKSTGPLTATSTYTFVCRKENDNGSGGATTTKSVTVKIAAALSCTLDGVTVAHGESRTFYMDKVGGYNDGRGKKTDDCRSVVRRCTNGKLSGSPLFDSSTCTVTATSTTGAPCTLNGVTIAHGASRAFFSTSTVSNRSCAAFDQVRTCKNGKLSGNAAFSFTSCTRATSTVSQSDTSNTASVGSGFSGSVMLFFEDLARSVYRIFH